MHVDVVPLPAAGGGARRAVCGGTENGRHHLLTEGSGTSWLDRETRPPQRRRAAGASFADELLE